MVRRGTFDIGAWVFLESLSKPPFLSLVSWITEYDFRIPKVVSREGSSCMFGNGIPRTLNKIATLLWEQAPLNTAGTMSV